MTGGVQIASDMSAQFNLKHTRILSFRCLTPVSAEKLQLLSSHAAGQGQSFQSCGAAGELSSPLMPSLPASGGLME